MKSLTFAIKFFSRFPWPGEAVWDAGTAARSLGALPVVGLFLGFWLAGGSYLLTRGIGAAWSPVLQAVLLIVWEWSMGGSLFLDGFADTCDGVLSGTRPDRALEIMHDSRIGSMGAVGLNLLFLLKTAMFVQLIGAASWSLWKWLIMYSCWSKWAVGMIVFWMKGAKKEGLAHFFHQERAPAAWWSGTALMVLAAAVLLPFRLWVTVLPLSGLAVLATALVLKKRLGGQTGDTYGFISQMAELSFLMMLILMNQSR